MQFITNSKKLIKFIKQFKLDNNLYFSIHAKKVILKVIDFKQCLGVIEGEYLQDNEIIDPFHFKIEYLDLISRLESFQNDVIFEVNELHQSLKLTDPLDSTFEYILKCQTGAKVKKYCQMNLVETDKIPKISLNMKGLTLNKIFKKICPVDSVVKFKFYRNHPTHLIHLTSKKLSNIGNLHINLQDVKNYIYEIDFPFFEIELYYIPLFTTLLKEGFDYQVCLHDNFLVLRKLLLTQNSKENLQNEDEENHLLWIPVRNMD